MSTTSKAQILNFSRSENLSYMQAMVADGTIKDIDEPYGEYGRTALMYQCYLRKNKGSLERVRFLLGCHPPAKINIKNSDGRTCLHMAIHNGRGGGDDPDLVRLLVENGADSSIKDKYGKTALDKAKTNKFNNSVDVICDWYRNKYEKILFDDDSAEIPANVHPFDGLLEDVLKEVVSRGRVLRLLLLLNHKKYDGFVDSLEYELREELAESLILEML